MESLGKLLGNFIIKNDNDVSLFKVYFYENGISFDKKFLKGVVENEVTNYQFKKINDVWDSEEKDKEAVVEAVMFMLEHNQDYLSDFFYSEENLNKNGDSIKNEIDLKNEFDIIKKTRDIKPITRKDFESKIVNEEIGDFYVENFEKAKKADFFTYKSEEEKDCFIMVVKNRIKIGFAEK